jgi:Ca2+-binding EF-hand superfamily protein
MSDVDRLGNIERELREALAEQRGWEGLLPEGPGLREATLPQRVDSLIRRLASDQQGAVDRIDAALRIIGEHRDSRGNVQMGRGFSAQVIELLTAARGQ